jgi:hypothetical protein
MKTSRARRRTVAVRRTRSDAPATVPAGGEATVEVTDALPVSEPAPGEWTLRVMPGHAVRFQYEIHRNASVR